MKSLQLDISRFNYLRVINAFTQIEAAKAYLFANSEFSGLRVGYQNFSIFGKNPCMLSILNVGVNTRLFKDE